ncbi:uncharacterized protein LOC120671964 [Panicum virgatum]|uniref:Uncharacterized protein n=1 Tax=Panicum virgatum TaxID=38727 RepID=A0A8T0RLX4_PANVG|nr:uncharacterized protein LOC120671964 [Panicum virgatum]KAG2586140.1 hypothetical protein PVAP13_5NG101400 [Panicum virgatum]
MAYTSAATATAVAVLLLASSCLSTAQVIRPELIYAFVREQMGAADLVSWAREIAYAQRENWCGEKGRRRPRDFPFKLGSDWRHPIGMKDGFTRVEGRMWGVIAFARGLQTYLCSAKAEPEERRCCCCGSSSRRCCCCCTPGSLQPGVPVQAAGGSQAADGDRQKPTPRLR